jgi:hypothetical protein
LAKADGSPKFDGVAFGEAEVKVIGFPAPVISAKFALVNSESGRRFGSIHKNNGWSEQTFKLFEELAASMEVDAASDLFDGVTSTTSGGVTVEPDTSDGVPGL